VFNKGLVGCILTGLPQDGERFAGLWIAELAFPSVIFVLTLGRTVYLRETGVRTPLISLMMRDGIMYFGAIFFVNAVNTVTYAVAPPDLKPVNASVSQLTTQIMICRLMLNLRDRSDHRGVVDGEVVTHSTSGKDNFTTSIIGNLGAPLDYSFDERRSREELEATPVEERFPEPMSPEEEIFPLQQA